MGIGAVKPKARGGDLMAKKIIGITGATGFVGCRLAERLVLADEYDVVAAIRRFSGAGLARLARLPVKMVQADLLDRAALQDAFADCEVVVHCAYGKSGSEEDRLRTTVEGTENVLGVAAEGRAKRAIHLSSAVVHREDGNSRLVDESTPFAKSDDPYVSMKIEAENAVWRFSEEQGFPVVVFRPPLIYGPYGRRWTVKVVQEVLAGAVLVDGGRGAANLVYIDNLIDALMLAIESDAGDGEAFLVVDDEELTWRDVYQAYADVADGAPALRSLSRKEIEAIRKKQEPGFFRGSFIVPFSVLPKLAKASVSPLELRKELRKIPWLPAVKAVLPGPVLSRLKGENSDGEAVEVGRSSKNGLNIPDRGTVELVTSLTRLDNSKVKNVMGHRQRIDFSEGMRRTADWLRYQMLVA